MKILLTHHRPGNVRELKSILEYAFVMAEDGLITPAHLPPKQGAVKLPLDMPATTPGGPEADEKTALIAALRQAGGNQSRAAALLGVSRVTVWHRMKKYGIDVYKLVTA